MPSLIQKFTANPLGRTIWRTLVQPVLHSRRRRAYPGLALTMKVDHVDCEGQRLKIYSRRHHNSDAEVLVQCFEQRQYDFPIGAHGAFIQRCYEEIIASGRQPLIIDCGANIGASVVWFSARYPKAHIVAIEPEPGNLEVLRLNVEARDVDLREVGVAAIDGESRLDITRESGMGSRTGDNVTGPVIPMISIATILAQKDASHYTPFILKIDIEGAEKPLFAGDCSAINRFPLIVVEPHDWLFPGTRSSTEFFRFHADTGREFCLKDENVASIVCDPSLEKIAGKRVNLQ